MTTQNDQILAYLSRPGATLTVREALLELGIYALSQRIGELKRDGVPIDRDMVKTSGGAIVARYRLGRVAYG